MSDEEMSNVLDDLTPEEIHDKTMRRAVTRLRKEFPDQSLGSCYYWYLYEKANYESTKSQIQKRSKPGQTLSHTIESSDMSEAASKVANQVDLGVFPAELWQNMCTHLEFDDLANLRLTNTGLADIAAETMVSRIRLDLSFESLERLARIAEHEHLRKGVQTLVFEAGLLAHAGCVHRYLAHYDLDHHAAAKPQPPGDEASAQALRLHVRNLAKYNNELEAGYAKYRKAFEAQQCLMFGPSEHLFSCIDNFPSLRAIRIAADECQHSLSGRFLETYVQDCAISMNVSPAQNTRMLQSMVRPGIESLTARQVQSSFFDGQKGRSREWLQSIFQNLREISLHLDAQKWPMSISGTSTLEATNLAYAIGSAVGLKELTISVSPSGSFGALFNIIPQGSCFPQLAALDICSFTTAEDDLFELLQNQTVLQRLDLGDVTLSKGSWQNLLLRMRHELRLCHFYATGIFIDPNVFLQTDDFYEVGAWVDGVSMSLGSAMDMYVTDPLHDRTNKDDEENLDWLLNPVSQVANGDFESFEDLVETYGPIDDSDLEGFFDDDEADDVEESDGSDAHATSDDQSMVTADEENGDEDNGMAAIENAFFVAHTDRMDMD